MKDPIVKKLITKYGELSYNKSDDLFYDLVESIVSQQLSVKASNTIFLRFKELFGKKFPSPKQILATPDEKLRNVGLSNAKVKYVKSLADFVDRKELILERLEKLSDEEIIIELTKVKGIGKWTAEMFLIFSLARPDVFSLGDLALKKAVSNLYKVDIDDLKKIEEISLTWSPNRSMVSRYLWKSLDQS